MSTVETAKVLDKIRERGYWSVVIRPTTFDEKRVLYSDLFSIIERNSVRYYRWGFPIVSPPELTLTGDDWVGQEFDRYHDGDIEVWRFYTSGLFVHYAAMNGDWSDQTLVDWDLPMPKDEKCKPFHYLYDLSTIYSFLQIFEFASRLALSPAGDSQMRVEITIHNLKGRQLVPNHDPNRPSNHHKAKISEWKYEQNFTQTDLIAMPRELAAKATVQLFDRFDAKISVEHIKMLQEKVAR